MAEMTQDTRHLAKVRDAADHTISEPGNTVATSPPARSQVKIISPWGRHAARTTSPIKGASPISRH